MAKFRTHYDNLKVSRDAPESVIKAAYKALCQNYHPDKFQGEANEAHRTIKIINEAHAVLSDPVRRAKHDRWIEKKEREQRFTKTNALDGDDTDFDIGDNNSQKPNAHKNGQQTTPPRRIIDQRYYNNGDGTVTDLSSGLQWMRCCMGQRWNGVTCIGEAKRLQWEEIHAACKALNQAEGFAGHYDWRLPTIQELKSLIEHNKEYLNGIAFPDAPVDRYWSSTLHASTEGNAYFVSFSHGQVSSNGITNDYFVRLVRNTATPNKAQGFYASPDDYVNPDSPSSKEEKKQGAKSSQKNTAQQASQAYSVPEFEEAFEYKAFSNKDMLARASEHIFENLFFYTIIVILVLVLAEISYMGTHIFRL